MEPEAEKKIPSSQPNFSSLIAYLLNTAESFECCACPRIYLEWRLKHYPDKWKLRMYGPHKTLNYLWDSHYFVELDWHNSLRYIELQVNYNHLCSQGVSVFKRITLATSVSQGDLWFSHNLHIHFIYLVVAIYKIRQPSNILKVSKIN
jgi:hypothetical protein